MSLTEALELHGFGQLGVLGDHQLNLLELCEIPLLVEVGDYSFQLGEGSRFSLSALRSRTILLYASSHRTYHDIGFSVFVALIMTRFGCLLHCSLVWAFRPYFVYLRAAVDNLDFLIWLRLHWVLPQSLYLRQRLQPLLASSKYRRSLARRSALPVEVFLWSRLTIDSGIQEFYRLHGHQA